MPKSRKSTKSSRAKSRPSRTARKTKGPKKTVKFNNTVTLGKGFPRKVVCTHKYVDVITMTGTAGAVATRQFVCNGMYDPDYTGVGHQPMYFDQLSAIYNHYTVIGSKIKVKTVNIYGAASSPAYYFTLCQNDDGTITYNTLINLFEKSDGTCKLVTASSTSTPASVNKWSAKKMFGGSILANDRLQGDIGANPAEITNWVVSIAAVDGVSTVTTSFLIEIEYIAVWEELKDVASS